jgi:hypothetical protein
MHQEGIDAAAAAPSLIDMGTMCGRSQGEFK